MSGLATQWAPGERERSLLQALGGRSVVLVGMMGAGKTAVGRRLAQRLDLAFRDADAEIEAAAQKTIPEIFETDGEAFFRDKERRVIARLLDEDHGLVLATGGGAFMSEETRRTIRERGVSIWLRADPDVLMRRVRRKSNRPLLKTADPEATLRALLAAREPVYGEADVIVHSREVAHDIVLDEVLAGLEAHLAGAPR
jgi:shikimate kinase